MGVGPSSPITVDGLTAGRSYTFTVTAVFHNKGQAMNEDGGANMLTIKEVKGRERRRRVGILCGVCFEIRGSRFGLHQRWKESLFLPHESLEFTPVGPEQAIIAHTSHVS